MICWDLDWREPLDAFAPLAGEAHAHILHGGNQSPSAEWSIIVAFPASIVSAAEKGVDPFSALDAALQERRTNRADGRRNLPFVSGALGFVGYESARFFEPTLDLPSSPFLFPDAVFGLYDAAAMFSRTTRQAYIVGRDEGACRRLRDALGDETPPPVELPIFGPLTSNFTRQRYQAAVRALIENILDGDFYQVNLSHQLCCNARSPMSGFQLFGRLVESSDAQHAALLQYGNGEIVSNSPERFFRIENRADGDQRILAEPIKGTRPRGDSDKADDALARALMADPKDRAENIMIADLMRNDLSKICRDGSVREESICKLLSLTNVHHLESSISGVLKEPATASSIFSALFPCGSVTGAPKIAAMQAIAGYEGIGRGPYCGAIGYIDDTGAADFSVSIRTLMIERECVTVPVGGGVTLRSNPTDEYEETLAKACGALNALGSVDLDGVR